MTEENEIVTETTNVGWFFITFFTVSMGGALLFGNIAASYRAPLIGLIGIVLFVIIPLFLLKKIMLIFTKRVKIVFLEDHLSILMMGIKSGLRLSEEQFFYQDIRSCMITSSQSKKSSITLYIINIGKKSLAFNNLKGADIGNVGENIYHQIKIRKPDIALKPTFFATNAGKGFMTGMAILLTILLLLHILYSPKTSPYTFMISLSFYLGMWAQRKKDLERFKQLSNE